MTDFESSVLGSQKLIGEQAATLEWLAAKAAYEGFCAAMSEWIPAPLDWNALSVRVRDGWLAAAKAARALDH
jgi:hypothetical protein